MEINYDKEADALYITLGEGTFSTNKKLDEHTILDLDENGHVIGIEFLKVSERMPEKAFSQVKLTNVLARA
jgi:uncharacterized protein YuzE